MFFAWGIDGVGYASAVGKEWRWAMDAPADIVAGALEQHVRMIHEFRGVPGVKPERLAEGMQVSKGPHNLEMSS